MYAYAKVPLNSVRIWEKKSSLTCVQTLSQFDPDSFLPLHIGNLEKHSGK